MDQDTDVKLAIYLQTAESGRVPGVGAVARRLDRTEASVQESFGRLAASRLLVLEADGSSIRMAPPFSAVPTMHEVEAGGVRYYGNCGWDAFGIVAALQRPGTVRSRCAQTGEPLQLDLGPKGPGPGPWRFHCPVPAARWWQDIVFT